MKRYKLLKDTPTIKAGTIFEEVVSDFDELKELVRITPVGAKTSPQWTIQDIDNFDEWFEEIKEYKRWRAKRGEWYWSVRASLVIDSDKEADHYIDDGRWEAGNYFKTEEEAELYGKKLVANQKLIDTAKKAWLEFNGSEGPDWSDTNQDKHFIEFCHEADKFYIYLIGFSQSLGQIYFPTEESAQWVIDNMRDDLKLVMGIE